MNYFYSARLAIISDNIVPHSFAIDTGTGLHAPILLCFRNYNVAGNMPWSIGPLELPNLFRR